MSSFLPVRQKRMKNANGGKRASELHRGGESGEERKEDKLELDCHAALAMTDRVLIYNRVRVNKLCLSLRGAESDVAIQKPSAAWR
jgi:hypothetical protein